MKLYSLILFLCCSLNLFSQELKIGKWERKGILSLGCELGLNSAYLVEGERKYDSFFKFEKVNGYGASVFARYDWSNNWGLFGALEYERKGANDKGFEVVYRLHYLQLSLMPTFSYKRFHAYLGPYLGYLLDAKGYSENQIFSYAWTADNFFPFDAGIKMGVGVSFLKRFELYLNHDMGLATVYSYPYYGADGFSVYGFWHKRNRSFSVSLRTTFKQVQLGKASQ